MSNTTKHVTEMIRSAKMLRRFANHHNKARRHRYERRKVSSLIRMYESDEDELS